MRATELPPLRMGLLSQCLLLLALLATWQGAETQPQEVSLMVLPGHNVRSGTNVTLQCVPKITSSTGKALTYQYTFYRERTMVYSENITSASQVDHYIPQARVANSGSYKCKVQVLEKSKESTPETLNVTGLQIPALILSKKYVTEGEQVVATCSAPKEFGSFYFFFYEGFEVVRKVPASNNSAQAELHFFSHGNKSLYCKYVIDLKPGSMHSSNSRTAYVYVQELSIRPSIEVLPNANVTEGDILNITCNVSGVHENPIQMYLSKDNDIKKSGPDSIIYSKRMLAEDSGVYECKSEIRNVLKTVKSLIMVAELFSKPVLAIEPKEVFENETFLLTCKSLNISTMRIQRNDVKYSIYWNNKILTPGNFAGNFRIRADSSFNGNYYCIADAKMIQKHSNIIPFKAKVLVSKPLMKVSDKVIVGKTFMIQCHCENGSLPISYTLLNNKVPQQPVQIVRQPNDTAFFTVTIKRKEDLKNFTCEAENNGHSSKMQSNVLNITVIEPVSSPSLLIMPYLGDVTEEEELHLECTVKEGSPPITFKWYREGSDKPLLTKTSTKRSESYVLERARRDHSGKYRCVAVNQANEIMRSEVAYISVSLARWKKVLIGAFCVILLVALIGFGYYRYRAKRGKRETATELSVKPSNPKSEDSLTVSLAHDTEVYNAHTDSGDARGRSVWSERESDSDTDDQSSVETRTKEPDVEYTEVVHPQPADTSRAPAKKGTDTVYSELQNSPQDVADRSGYGSVEYAQLNHDLPEPV